MQAQIVGELGVECSDEHAPGATHHRIIAQPGEHVDSDTDRLDSGRTDEDRVERTSLDPYDVEIGLERIDLTAIAVAPHREIDAREALLIGTAVEHLACEQDQPRARKVAP